MLARPGRASPCVRADVKGIPLSFSVIRFLVGLAGVVFGLFGLYSVVLVCCACRLFPLFHVERGVAKVKWGWYWLFGGVLCLL